MSGDKVIRGAAMVVAFSVAGIGVVMTSIQSYGLGRNHGQDQADAFLLPVSTGGLVLTASLALLHEARNQRSAPGLARVMLWTGIAVMTGAAIVSGARYGLLGAILPAWPAVACGGVVETAVQFVRRCGEPRQGAVTSQAGAVVPDAVRDAVRAAYRESVRAGAPLSQAAMAVRFGLSRRKIRQLVPECTTYSETRRRGGKTA